MFINIIKNVIILLTIIFLAVYSIDPQVLRSILRHPPTVDNHIPNGNILKRHPAFSVQNLHSNPARQSFWYDTILLQLLVPSPLPNKLRPVHSVPPDNRLLRRHPLNDKRRASSLFLHNRPFQPLLLENCLRKRRHAYVPDPRTVQLPDIVLDLRVHGPRH